MSWYRRALNVFRPGRLRRDIERELAFHLAERVDELTAAGVEPGEAARVARAQFGHYQSRVEEARDVDISQRLGSLVQDVRIASRGLRKAPAFSLTVMLTLALSIGASSAVFSALNAVLLRPLPFPHADQLVALSQSRPPTSESFVAPVRLEDWNRLSTAFQGITGYYTDDVSELSGDLPERLTRALVAPRFLAVWQIAPVLGRGFTREEEHFGGPPAVLISERLWRRRFGSDPTAVGRTLRFGSTSFSIVGVLPAGFLFPVKDTDVWTTSAPDAPYAQSRESTWFTAIGRLKTGVTLDQARANLAAVQAGLGREFPKTDADVIPIVAPLKEITVGGVRRSLWILYGSVSLLLLIACANIAALLLARGAGRQHEVALRFSLGASRASVAGYLLTEVVLLALAGAAAGLFLAGTSAAVFRALAGSLPRVDEIVLDWRVVVYALGCAAVCALGCGLVPALRATRRDTARQLTRDGRSLVSRGHQGQFVLVGVQVALAVTLLAGAGLLVRSFQELARISPGFDATHVLAFRVTSNWGETTDPEVSRQRSERILDAVRSIPGVRGAATSAFNLPGVPASYEVEMNLLEGPVDPGRKILAQVRSVSPSYFATLRVPILAGDLCRDESGRMTMMVNKRFVERYVAPGSVIGRHLAEPGNPIVQRSAEVTGVVGDVREAGLDHDPVPTAYLCSAAQQPNTNFLVRTDQDPSALMGMIRLKVREVEPRRSVYATSLLTDHIAGAYAENRLRTILLVFFALASVSLACVGLYGTLSYLVTVRRREIALRLALGAMRSQVIWPVLASGLRVSLAGGIAGLVLAAASTRVLAGMLFGVSRSDPATVGGVAGLVLVVSTVASLVPALRAARFDPMRVLREE